MCPGHEMIGVVIEVGKSVKKFKAGDFAAVGNMVDSCGDCSRCKADEEQYCAKGFTPTYNGKCVLALLFPACMCVPVALGFDAVFQLGAQTPSSNFSSMQALAALHQIGCRRIRFLQVH